MNRQEILNRYESDEDRLLVSKLLDKIEFVLKRNSVEFTDFLDMRQRGILEKVLHQIPYKKYIVYGGYAEAERTVIILYPEKLEDIFQKEQFDFNQVMKAVHIRLPSEERGNYSHRDYLGGIMKLGIKREKIGDILVSIDGADIITSSELTPYLVSHLIELTRFHKSDITEIKIEHVMKTLVKKEILNIIIPSMRLDSIVSEVIKTSRSKANEIIGQERVFVNFEVVTKNAKMLKENDILTIRGKGRFEIKNILNYTKKGNLVLEVEKYV